MTPGNEIPRADLPPMPPGDLGALVEPEGPRGELVANAVARELDLGAWIDSEGAGTTVYYVYEKATLRYSALAGKVVCAEVYDQRTGKAFILERPVLDAALSQHLGALRTAEVAKAWSRFGFERANVVWNTASGEVEVEWPAVA